MKASKIIEEFNLNQSLNVGTIENTYIEDVQLDLVSYLKEQPNREFALYLLSHSIAKRENENLGLGDLMFASFIVALHKIPKDSLLIWKAKTVDFDTYCGHDIQLIAGGGVDATVEFLNSDGSKEGKDALDYLIGCVKAGDFENIDSYFNDRPWLVWK